MIETPSPWEEWFGRWGEEYRFPCGHRALVLGEHDTDSHSHWCPLCEPTKRECLVEYFDVH